MMGKRERLVVAAVVVTCFAGGLGLGKRSGETPDTVADPVRDADRRVVSALDGSPRSQAAGALSKLARGREHGVLVRMRGYLALIDAAETEDFPELIAAIAREVPDSLGGGELMEMAVMRWVERDAMGALGALLAFEPACLERVGQTLFREVAKAEPVKGLNALLGIVGDGRTVISGRITSGEFQVNALRVFLGAVVDEDPKLAVEMIAGLENPVKFRGVILDQLLAVAQKDAPLAMAALDDFAPGILPRGDTLETLFAAYAREDRAAAMAAIEPLAPRQQAAAVGGIVESWGREDPRGALEWLRQSGIRNDGALGSVLVELVETDSAAVMEAIDEARSPQTRGHLAGRLAGELVEQDASGTLDWARERLEGDAQNRAFASILDEERGLEFESERAIAEALPPRYRGRTQFVGRWGSRDPEAAAGWAMAQEGDGERLFRRVADRWLENDADAFEAFASSLSGDFRTLSTTAIEWRREQLGEVGE